MESVIKILKEKGQFIGSMGFGDCLYQYVFELYQKDNRYFLREKYTAGDDDGYDRLKEISPEEAKEFQKDEEFYAA